MALSVNNNSLTLGLLNSLNQARDKEETALERLSTGKKVNSAADNAAALALIEEFSSQIAGAAQAIRNSSDGISFSAVAEAGLESVSDDIQRIRELTIQASSGALQDSDRAVLQAEVSQLQQGISDRLEQTNFNGVDLFNSEVDINFQVGANAGDTIELSTRDLASELTNVSSVDISTEAGAQSALAELDSALQTVSDQRVTFGAVQNRFESNIDSLRNNLVNTSDARSRIEDADVAREVSEQIRGRIQQQSGIAVQALANSSAQLALRLLS